MPAPHCSRCDGPLRSEGGGKWTRCQRCGAATQLWVFPAFHAPRHCETRVGPGEGACFSHPAKRAAGACGECDRLVCSLCRIDLGAGCLCPACANRAGSVGNPGPLQNEAVIPDRLALILGLWPLLLFFTLQTVWPVYLLTAGGTFYVVIRFWAAPGGAFLPRPPTRLIFAALFACLQLGVAAACAWSTFRR